MKIYHFCQFKLRHSNGVQAAVWELARAQATSGEEAEIISLGRAPSAVEMQEAAQAGVRLRGYAGKWPDLQFHRALLEEIEAQREAVCHFHSVFILGHSLLALQMRRRRIPYFISPHGNLAPRELKRKTYRKAIYLQCLENGVLSGAAGCLCASQLELRTVTRWVRQPGAAIVIGNGMDTRPFSETGRPRSERPRNAVFLGKSDLYNKAFDRMVDVAGAFGGGVDFYVVAHNQPHLRAEYTQFVAAATAGSMAVRFHEPVYGAEKLRILREASFYLHLSRWDVFGMGIMEAAMSGLPLVLSSDCDIAEEARAAGAAYVMTSYDAAAVDALRRWASDDQTTALVAIKAREWALANYAAPRVAEKSLRFYRERLGQS